MEDAQAAPAPPAHHAIPLPAVMPNNQLEPDIGQLIDEINQLNVNELPRRLLLDLSFDDVNLLIGKARTLVQVPKRVLPTATRALTKYLNEIKVALEENRENDLLFLLKKLYLFQFVVCSAPTEPCPNGVTWNKHMATILLARANKLLNDDWSNFYLDYSFQERIIPVAEGATRVRVRNGPRTRSMTEGQRRYKRIVHLVDKGMLSKAYDRVVKDTKGAPANDATAQKLRNLYPERQKEVIISAELRQILDGLPPIVITGASQACSRFYSKACHSWCLWMARRAFASVHWRTRWRAFPGSLHCIH